MNKIRGGDARGKGERPAPQAIEAKTAEFTTRASLSTGTRVLAALCQLGFPQRDASAAIGRAFASEPSLGVEQLLRKSLLLLLPIAS